MNHAEVIYEDGSHSIVAFDSSDELQNFLKENHRRASEGEPSSAQDSSPRTDLDPNDNIFAGRTPQAVHELGKNRPAFRAKRVFTYDQHPADLVPVGNEGSMPVSADTVKELVDGMAGDSGQVNMHQLTQALRDEASPVNTVNAGKFESHYKMDGSEMDLAFLSEGGA